MEKVISIIILFLSINSFAQNEIDDRTTLLSVSGTISPGYLLNQKESTINLHGFAEYYLQTNVSLKGDVSLLMSGKNENVSLFQNTDIFFGLGYHLTKSGKFDPWIALQGGVGIVEMKAGLLTSEMEVVPLISPSVGVTFQMSRWFFLFAQGRYVGGKAQVTDPFNSSLSEVRFSIGLGLSYIDKNRCNTCPHW